VTPPHLAHPEWLSLVASAVAAIAALVVVSFTSARRRARRLLGSAVWVPPGQLLRDLALVAALALAAVALLGPYAGMKSVRSTGSGVDVVLLVDVSRSMDATDVAPSRLHRARTMASRVLAKLGPDDRAALAAFAGRGVLLTPLTPDLEALDAMIASLDSDLIQPSGSEIGAGIAAAAAAFEAASERPRLLLALSDGEDPDATGDLGANAAQRAGARVVAVALGSDGGASVPDGAATLQDSRGRPVVSRRDLQRLMALATATDGVVFAADRWGDVDEGALLGALKRDAGRGRAETVERRAPASRTTALAALAFALLLLEWIGGPRTWIAPGWPLRRTSIAEGFAAIAAGFAAIALAAAAIAAESDTIARLEARLRERPGDTRLLVALGVARAEQGRSEEAGFALRAAALGAREARDAAVAYYDLGVLEVRRQRYAAARDAFLDALALAPDDLEARFNLEWSLLALARTEAEPEQRRADESAPEIAERPDPQQPDPQQPPAPRDGDGPKPPSAQPKPATAGGAEPGRGFAPELSPDRAQQWLDSVADDPGRAVRAAARDASEPHVPRTGSARW
jgi:Ca-activated chloride channel homolog